MRAEMALSRADCASEEGADWVAELATGFTVNIVYLLGVI